MKAEDVDSALVRAGAILRASMEQQVDVDHAFDRLRDSIRARTTPAAAVSEMARSGGRAGEELTHPVAQHAGDPDPDGTDRWVAGVLREMRPSDREILIETYFRGRTVAEAAAKLHLPLGTAKARTYRAMRALRAALEQGHR